MTATPALIERRTRSDVARGLVAAIALVAFVVGVPIALVALAPTYMPHPMPTRGQLWDRVLSTDDGTLLLAVLAAVAWITWVSFTGSVLIEVFASARRVRAPSIPLLGGMQHAASRLLATAGLLLATASSISVPAPAATASALVVPMDRQPSRATPLESLAPVSDVPEAAPAHPATPRAAALPTVTVKRGDTLWDIAEHHLGDPMRYTEIRDLNLGRTQPDGRRLRDADWVLPGWVLLLPADATDTEPPVTGTSATAADSAIYVVKPSDSLWGIAEMHFGDGARYPELLELNQGVTQPDGARLTDADLIRPGWALRLPSGTSTAAALASPADAKPPGAPAPTSPHAVAQPTGTPTVAPAEVASAPAVPGTTSPQAFGGGTQVAADPTDEADDARPAHTWFLGFAGLGAVGIVGEIARRRHLQQRARKVGETIPLPEPGSPAAVAECVLRGAAAPVSIDAIRTNLTNVAYRCFNASRDLPRIGALLLDEQHVRLLLVDDAPESVAPFTAQGSRTWVATTADVAAEQLIDDPDQANPYPLLVVLGHTDESTVILNLEAAGTLTILGDEPTAEDVLRALVMETATSDLASQLSVHVDEPLADLEGAFEGFRLSATAPRDERTRIEADVAAGLVDAGLQDTLQLRGDGAPPDLWLPYISVEHALPASPSGPWSGVVTITRQRTDAAWTIQVAADGSAQLEPLGIGYQPQRLTIDHAEQLRSVLVTSLPPEPRRTPAEPMTTLAADVTALTTANPPLPPVHGDEQPVSIDVLGPIQFRGLPPAAKSLTPRMKELLVYLALHGPTTGADLEDVLWNGERIQHGTRGTLAYRTRTCVGPEVLPKASDDGTFELGPAVTTDWTDFQHLVADALTCAGQERIDRLTQALDLVRDQPFRGISGGQFPWADYDIELMTSAIADAAHLLARLLHESGDHRGALDAAMRGLTAEPFSESLQQLAISATQAVGGEDAARRLRQRFTAEMARLDPELA